MTRTSRFAAVLARLRSEQGFRNAFSFYNKRGGRRAFGIAFANYLNIEKGVCLPKGDRLPVLVAALGLRPESGATRELLVAYLADLTRSQALLASLDAPAPEDPAPAGWRLAQDAAGQAVAQRKVQISIEQYAALAADARAYACHVILANTRGGMTKKRLAAAAQLDARGVEAALSVLRAAGLAKTTKDAASSPLAGKFVAPPVLSPASAAVYARLKKHRQAWKAEHGAGVQADYLVLRARKGRFGGYLPHLSGVVSMSAVYGDVEPGPDSEIYLVEGSITRLFG